MKLLRFLLFSFALLIFAACRPAAAPKSISEKPTSINNVPLEMPPTKPVEEMTWTIFNGSTNQDGAVQKLRDLQGKVVVLDFWATYCPPCLKAIPHLKELEKRHGKENIAVIGLHVGGEEDRPKVPIFVEELKIDYALATPEDELTRFIFGKETAIPQTAVFDRQGKLVKKIVGFDDEIKTMLDEIIEQTVKK